jgi:tetratricopeptide (TPR) repeat protein
VSTGEQVDLDPQRQREVLELESRLEAGSHFEVLGISAGATADEVRSAFRELSRKFHPDRYFGKNLGDFRTKLDRIFKRLVEANQTLSDPERRQAYLASNPFVRAAVRAAAPQVVVEAPRSEAELKRGAERRDRLSRHPYLLKVNRMHELLARVRESMAKAEYSRAFTYLNQAAEADPLNSEVRTLLIEVRRLNDAQRAESSYQHGVEALARFDEALALQAFRAAAAGGHALGAHKASILVENAGGDQREATALAQRAVELDGKNVSYRLALARLLERAGMKALARKHLEEASRLDPGNLDVKKQVKRRWPF